MSMIHAHDGFRRSRWWCCRHVNKSIFDSILRLYRCCCFVPSLSSSSPSSSSSWSTTMTRSMMGKNTLKRKWKILAENKNQFCYFRTCQFWYHHRMDAAICYYGCLYGQQKQVWKWMNLIQEKKIPIKWVWWNQEDSVSELCLGSNMHSYTHMHYGRGTMKKKKKKCALIMFNVNKVSCVMKRAKEKTKQSPKWMWIDTCMYYYGNGVWFRFSANQ